MKKFYITLIAVSYVFIGNAQMLTPTVISSTGGFSTNGGNGSLSYTVGEMTMVETFSANGNILTQGFQQPNDNMTGILAMTQDEFGSFAVYPNPAVDNIWFGVELPEAGKISIGIYDIVGQKVADVYNRDYTNGKVIQQTNVSTFAAAQYFLTMTFTSDKDGKVHTTTKKFQVIN